MEQPMHNKTQNQLSWSDLKQGAWVRKSKVQSSDVQCLCLLCTRYRRPTSAVCCHFMVPSFDLKHKLCCAVVHTHFRWQCTEHERYLWSDWPFWRLHKLHILVVPAFLHTVAIIVFNDRFQSEYWFDSLLWWTMWHLTYMLDAQQVNRQWCHCHDHGHDRWISLFRPCVKIWFLSSQNIMSKLPVIPRIFPTPPLTPGTSQLFSSRLYSE